MKQKKTGLITFEQKAKLFVNKHKNIIKDAVRFYKNRPGGYEDDLIQTIYNFFDQELGEDWTNQISAPNPEDEKIYNYGWTDEKDEVFCNILKSILKTGLSLNKSKMDEAKKKKSRSSSGLITFEQLKQVCFEQYGFEDDEDVIEEFKEAKNIDELVNILDGLGYNGEEAYDFIFSSILK